MYFQFAKTVEIANHIVIKHDLTMGNNVGQYENCNYSLIIKLFNPQIKSFQMKNLHLDARITANRFLILDNTMLTAVSGHEHT